MRFWMIEQGRLRRMVAMPQGMTPIVNVEPARLAGQIETLHRAMQQWAQIEISPGPLTAARVFVGGDGFVAFSADDESEPLPLMAHVGPSQDLAGWLVLLDKWVDQERVLQSARTVWSAQELAGALPFMTPAFLPAELVNLPPQNCAEMARALSALLVQPPVL